MALSHHPQRPQSVPVRFSAPLGGRIRCPLGEQVVVPLRSVGLHPVQNLERRMRGNCAFACLLSAHRNVTCEESSLPTIGRRDPFALNNYEKIANQCGVLPSKAFGRMPIFFILETWQPGFVLTSPTSRSCPTRKSLAKNAVVGTAIVKSELLPVDRDTDEDEE